MRVHNTLVALTVLLLSATVSSLESATLSIDFTSVLGPQVTACPVSNSASISALNSCEDDQFSSVFKKCLVVACGKVTCSWYKSVANNCLGAFCAGQSTAWSDWASSKCLAPGAGTAVITSASANPTSTRNSALVASTNSPGNTASTRNSSSTTAATATATATASVTASATLIITTPKAGTTDSQTSVPISGTQAAASSTRSSEATGHLSYWYGGIVATLFGALAAIL